MIQRIQSFYAMAAGILLACMIFIPLGKLSYSEGKMLLLMANGFYDAKQQVFPSEFLRLMLTSCSIISISIILYYKKRTLQMRLCIYTIVLIIVTGFCQLYYWFKCKNIFTASSAQMFIPFVFPVIAIILLFLAYKAIKKDDDLVKSVDRIR
jgi:hypothetical protein